jgi:RimJ/RimL family protein N-acetyltransferase
MPLSLAMARRMLAGGLQVGSVEDLQPAWHPEYPLPDSLDAIAMVIAAHGVMTGAVEDPSAWWVHQIVVDGVVVGDVGFHGPPGMEKVVEIGYSVVPAWRGRGVASRACDLIMTMWHHRRCC